jgi:hypothetical protein
MRRGRAERKESVLMSEAGHLGDREFAELVRNAMPDVHEYKKAYLSA